MIRAPAVAGAFYPADANDLQAQIETMLARAEVSGQQPGKAMIVPHAGYIYSGQIAANAFRLLKNSGVKNVALLGPAHYVYVKGLAVPSSTHFSTPLGNVPLNTSIIGELLQYPQVNVSDEAHAPEHSLEVQIPFLQMVLDEFQLIPILVGDVSAEESAKIVDHLWGGEETLVLVSSDLSHFHPYTQAQLIDQETSAKICNMSESLQGEQACGCRAINGLMHLVRQRNMEVTELARCNSGDTAGDKNRVVGYGSFLLN